MDSEDQLKPNLGADGKPIDNLRNRFVFGYKAQKPEDSQKAPLSSKPKDKKINLFLVGLGSAMLAYTAYSAKYRIPIIIERVAYTSNDGSKNFEVEIAGYDKDTWGLRTVDNAFYGFSKGKIFTKDDSLAFFVEDAKKFMIKGGNLILLRCPSSGGAKESENHGFPRIEYWDQLLIQTKAKGYHYEDYESINKFVCPEWSHLSVRNARIFTTEIARIMKNDGALTIPNNQ